MKLCTHTGCNRPYLAKGYCSTHYQRLRRYPSLPKDAALVDRTKGPAAAEPADKFFSHVNKNGPTVAGMKTPCWVWLASEHNKGYGQFMAHESGKWKPTLAHKWLWEHLNGPVENGKELDHLCRNRLCVNPDHLEPVTHKTNMRRGVFGSRTHCVRGHAFDEKNTYTTKQGFRQCRECIRIRGRKSWVRTRRR